MVNAIRFSKTLMSKMMQLFPLHHTCISLIQNRTRPCLALMLDTPMLRMYLKRRHRKRVMGLHLPQSMPFGCSKDSVELSVRTGVWPAKLYLEFYLNSYGFCPIYWSLKLFTHYSMHHSEEEAHESESHQCQFCRILKACYFLPPITVFSSFKLVTF